MARKKSYNDIQSQWVRMKWEARDNPERLARIGEIANRYLENIHRASPTQRDFNKSNEESRKEEQAWNNGASYRGKGSQFYFDRALDRKFSKRTYMGNNKG